MRSGRGFVTVPNTPAKLHPAHHLPPKSRRSWGDARALGSWHRGSPWHSHPGDDMTVVVEGKMAVQFFRRESGRLVPDGEPLILSQGRAGCIAAGRIHDAQYRTLQAGLRS